MKILIFVFNILFFTGCATGYHPDGFGGGFSETKLTSDTAKIMFRGNGYTSAHKVQDYALLRAAEYTTENGFKYFYIVNSNGSRSDYLMQTSAGHVQYNQYSNTATIDGPTYMNVSKTSEVLLIKMTNESSAGTLDARELKRNLSKSLGVDLKEQSESREREPSSEHSLPPEINTKSREDNSDYWSK